MKIKFTNANILSFDSPENIVFGEVAVDGNKIVFVGEKCPKSFVPDRTIDVGGNALLPGLINAHTHSAMVKFRGIKDDVALEEWLFDNIIPLEEKLTPQDVYDWTLRATKEYIQGGITTIEDMYYFPDKIADAILQSGIRANICFGPISALAAGREGTNDYIISLSKKHPDYIKPVSSAHAIYTVGAEQFDELVNYSAKHNLRVSTHLAETLKEVGDCTVKNDMTPVQLLESYGFLDREATLYHCVHVDKDDAQILKDYNASVVSCPSSNIKLASGIAPLNTFLHLGLNVALGTDGASSNNRLDMFREMFLASTLTKVSLNDPTVVPAINVLEMATKNGAIALGREKLGEIKEGYFADIILVDCHSLNMTPCSNIVSNLVYCATANDVYFTMCNGKILFEK